jgi:hypothetical protein
MIEANRAKGQATESAFCVYMQSKGWVVRKAPIQVDRKQHIDFYCTKGERKITVDVKSKCPIDGKVWIEIASERNTPWAYALNVSHIAWQTNDGFLLVPRKKVVQVIKDFYSNALQVTSDCSLVIANPKTYLYRRANAKREKILLVDINYLTRTSFLTYFAKLEKPGTPDTGHVVNQPA